MQAVAELDGFSLAIGSRPIFVDMQLAVPAQGCTVLMGPSGTGKSSLLRTLSGQLQTHPQTRMSGQIRVTGLASDGAPEAHAPVLVAQKAELLLASVWENLVAHWPERSRYPRMEQTAYVAQHLTRLGQQHLLDLRDSAVIDLPMEARRRIGIVSKSLAPSSLLMIDEPTANLSDKDCEGILLLIQRLALERPVLVVTHNLRHARAMANQVILVASGGVQEAANVRDFFEHPKSDSAKAFLRSGSCPEEPLVQYDKEADESDDFPATEPMGLAPMSPMPAEKAEVVSESGSRVPAVSPILGSDVVPKPLVPKPQIRARGPRGFVWLLVGQLAGTPMPGLLSDAQHDLRALQEAGVSHLLSLTEVPFSPSDAKAFDISCSALPMPDMQAPSVADGQALCEWIDRLLQAGHSVAVHCKAGLGRTGTVLAMYAIWHKKASDAKHAMTMVRALNAGMIQSVAQELFLEKFARELERKNSSSGAV